MFQPHIASAAKVLTLILLALTFASPATASSCMGQGQATFQSCMENFGADGTLTAWEEGVCSSFAADIVTVCEQQNKPAFQPLAECSRNWTFSIYWDEYPGEFTAHFVFSGPLTCS